MCPGETELVSLSSATVAPADVAKDLQGAHGEEEALRRSATNNAIPRQDDKAKR